MESEDMEIVLKLMIRGIGLITEAMEFSLMKYQALKEDEFTPERMDKNE